MAEEEKEPEEAPDEPKGGPEASDESTEPSADAPKKDSGEDAPDKAEEKPAEKKAEEKPAEEKPAEKKAEEKPAEEKPAEKKADDGKPEAKKPEAKPAEKKAEKAEEKEEEKPPMASNEDTEAFAGNPDYGAEQVEDIRPDIPAFRVPRENLVEAMKYLQQGLGYDHLACITAIDWKEGKLEVVYNLWSYAKNRPMAVRVSVTTDDPVVPSVTSLWKGADWLEREEYDLMGIRFEGHPDLRRIMLPEGWQGHPLRKDYDVKHEQYVGMDDEGNDVVYQEPREDAW